MTLQSYEILLRLISNFSPAPLLFSHKSTELTSVQQKFHYGEVGVGDSVVKGCIPVAVSHIYDKLQQLRGD